MSKQNIIITIIIVLFLAAVGWVVVRSFQNSEPNENENTQTNQNQSNNESNSNPNQNNTPSNANTTADCKKDFDPGKLKDQVSISGQVVTMAVRSFGTIKIQLYDKDVPKTVENFVRLAHAGFYDCLTFHRVAQGFVVQGGDPNGTGSGGITASGQPLGDEYNQASASYKTGYVKGVIAMARTQAANSATSQFFITLDDLNQQLTKDYVIFGKVIAGQDVVDKIGRVSVTPVLGPTDGTPVQPVVIEKVTLSK